MAAEYVSGETCDRPLKAWIKMMINYAAFSASSRNTGHKAGVHNGHDSSPSQGTYTHSHTIMHHG